MGEEHMTRVDCREMAKMNTRIRTLTEALRGLVKAYDVRLTERGNVVGNTVPTGEGAPWKAALEAIR